jgi:hypothetical protein
MTLSNFISKLNWRLMIVHILACWFFFHALWQLGLLYDYSYLEEIRRHINEHNYKDFNSYKWLDGHRITMIQINAILIALGGLLAGFVLSLLLSFKHKWFWVNSVIVLLVTFGLFSIDRFYFNYLRPTFQAPGKLFKADWACILANGLTMLAIGLLLFFLKRVIKFIDGKKAHPEAVA